MFWRFGISASSIDTLLQKHEDSQETNEKGLLELLLDEDDLLQECKARNTRLMEFLCKPTIVARMISYVTGFPVKVKQPTLLKVALEDSPTVEISKNVQEETTTDAEKPRQEVTDATQDYITVDVGVPAWVPASESDPKSDKYPYLCSELIACDDSTLTDAFMDPDLLKQLWSFLCPSAWNDNPLLKQHFEKDWDPLRCSYWSRVNATLLSSRRGEDLLKTLLQLPNDEPLNGLLQHLENSSFADLLLRIVGCEVGETEMALKLDSWLRNGRLIPRLLAMMDPKLDGDTHVTAAQTLLDVIAVSYQSLNPAGEPHAQALLQIHHHNQQQKEEYEQEMQNLREERLAMIGVGPKAEDGLDTARQLAQFEVALPPPTPPVTIFGGGPLMTDLKSETSIRNLVNFMLDTSSPHHLSSLTNGINVIIELIRRYCSDIESAELTHHQHTVSSSIEGNNGRHPITDSQIRALAQDLDGLLKVISSTIKDWAKALEKPHQGPGLGAERLRICELLAEVLHLQYLFASSPLFEVMVGGGFDSVHVTTVADDLVNVTLEIVETKALITCLDLFFQFPWNNFLHSVVYDMIAKVFNTFAYASSACMESNDGPFLKTEPGRIRMEKIRNSLHQLVLTILKQGQLTERILEAQRLNDYEERQPRGLRLGYMGHLTHVADECCKLWEKCQEDLQDDVGIFFESENWQDYSTRILPETKQKDQAPLGGTRPNQGGIPLNVLNGLEMGDGLTLGGAGITALSMMDTDYSNDDDLSSAKVLQLKPPKWRRQDDYDSEQQAFAEDSSDEEEKWEADFAQATFDTSSLMETLPKPE